MYSSNALQVAWDKSICQMHERMYFQLRKFSAMSDIVMVGLLLPDEKLWQLHNAYQKLLDVLPYTYTQRFFFPCHMMAGDVLK